ncbi:uncharacterized protein LOC104583888 isoform X2 [Brachypodium distachyon]|uniref:uncharacterized protein LOC104583888 isoform X2 n=1 Tax=Brachypodium distachyon TaxID=15368 RepID=UPI000D0DED86|nr:uncharacterized protein LOC104583888 isoform X2 [Brachypodium distachyon]|eukprot:XP_024316806.1 uncharacterized protein LOC104583888 isoform X2 [Brachypodium distachyon]
MVIYTPRSGPTPSSVPLSPTSPSPTQQHQRWRWPKPIPPPSPLLPAVLLPAELALSPEVIFGTRSECDADNWTCTECNIINKSQQFLIFTIPAFTCTSCKKPFAGDFDFCLASVMANGLPLVDKVLCEKDGEGNCIAYAIVQSIGIIHRIHIALASNNGKLDIGLAKMPVEREVLIDAYSKKFPVEVGQVGGVHKLIHMCQDVVEHGVELKPKGTPEVFWRFSHCPRWMFLRRHSSLLCRPLEVSALLLLELFAQPLELVVLASEGCRAQAALSR